MNHMHTQGSLTKGRLKSDMKNKISLYIPPTMKSVGKTFGLILDSLEDKRETRLDVSDTKFYDMGQGGES